MIIEIKGAQFVNKGAELMLHAILQQMRTRWPEAELALFPNKKSSYKDRVALGAYQKLSFGKNSIDLNFIAYLLPKPLRRWLKNKWGIVTEADISVVFDASGFAYGDQWKGNSIKNLNSEILRAHQHNKKYILLPQALGPFTRQKDIKKLQSSFPKATLICAREEASLKHVNDVIKNAKNTYQYPDFTNLVKGICPDYYTDGKNKVLIIPNSNMLSKRNNNAAWADNYIRVLIDAIEIVKSKSLDPVLLNHEGANDNAICLQLNDIYNGELTLINEPDPIKVKGIIGASHAIICSRFHGCVSALSQGVPNLGTSWSHKYERLFEEYAQSNCLISPTISKQVLQSMFDESLTLPDTKECSEARKFFKDQANAMWDHVQKVL